MLEPDVSVVIPTHRRERQVVEAIESALSQQNVNLEVIVLDDTTDGTARDNVAAIGDARVRYVKRETPSGGKPALVRNEAIGLARGRYLYFLDDDDHVLPGALSALSRALDARPSLAVAYGTVHPFGDNAAILARYTEWFDWAARISRRLAGSSWLTAGLILFRGTPIINSACMMRRTCAVELGGYDSSMPVYEDVDFHMRGIRLRGHVFVDHPTLHYRTGAPSMIHNLKGDEGPVAKSYKIMHGKYKAAYGMLDYSCLQLASKLLPASVPTSRADATS